MIFFCDQINLDVCFQSIGRKFDQRGYKRWSIKCFVAGGGGVPDGAH